MPRSDELKTGPNRDVIVLGVNTGIRIRAEGLGLRWSDVDFSRNILSVQATDSKSGQTRNIPLNSRVRDVLSRPKAQRPNDFVFSQTYGLTVLLARQALYEGLSGCRTRRTDSRSIPATIPLPHDW
jgi:integrase